MKVNELMIDDWVYRTDFNTPVPSKIIGMEVVNYDKMEYVVDVFNKNGYNVQLYLNEIEPIPLTPEILEKIGFETQPNIGYIIDDWDGTQIIYDRWNHNLRIIKNYKLCLDIETFDDMAVHELQHALRLCGIDKTITL